jgi:hypothetical protein
MELGAANAPRLDDGSAPRGSNRASRADVRSNHGAGFASSEDRGPRRFLINFSNYSPCVSPRLPSFPEGPYHLNVFRGPPSLPVIFFGSAFPIYQACEVGHGSTEQRLVTVAAFEYAHDTTLCPLIGECTDILRETIEKRGRNFPIVPRH